MATITVDSTGNGDARDSVLTLYEAIEVANGTLVPNALSQSEAAQVSGAIASHNTIAFDIPGSGVHAIDGNFPTITSSVTIDGYTEPGTSVNTATGTDNAALLIELTGSDGTGLAFNATGDCVVRGLILNGLGNAAISGYFNQHAIQVSGNFIGTDPTGTAADPNTYGGLNLTQTSGFVIGGPSLGDRNVILAGGPAVSPISSPTVHSNYGVNLWSSSNGTITGNFIGVNATGNPFPGFSPLEPNYSISLTDTSGTTIGGLTASLGNVLDSVFIAGSSSTNAEGKNVVEGNKIGVNAAGTGSLGSQVGVAVVNSMDNIIGGTGAVGNVISGNLGIDVLSENRSSSLNTKIVNNTINPGGPGFSGEAGNVGIRLASSGNIVGGLSAGQANFLGSDTSYGIAITDSPARPNSQGSGSATNNQLYSNVILNSAILPIVTINTSASSVPRIKLVALNSTASTYLVAGTIPNAAAGQSYLVQIYTDKQTPLIGSGPQAQTLLATKTVVAATNGPAFFSVQVAASQIPSGSAITVEETQQNGSNTSGLSADVAPGSPVATRVVLNVATGTPVLGQPYTVAAILASDAGHWVVPTGKTVFYDNGVPLAVEPVENGVAFYHFAALTPGPHVITVRYSGDALFPGGVSAAGSIVSPPRVVSVTRSYTSATQMSIQVAFDSAIDASTATNLNNYVLFALKPQGNDYTLTGNPFGVASATYNADTHTVTLVGSYLPKSNKYVLAVIGTSASGIKNGFGLKLDGEANGSPGTNSSIRF